MYKHSAAVAAIAVLVIASSAAQEKFKSGTLTVPLYVTVTDAEKRLVPDLERGDFEVFDNGKVQPLTLFENKSVPIAAVVMLDSSGSMTLILDRVKQGAEQFLIRLLPEDTGRVGAFNDKIQFLPQDEFTSDRDLLVRSLQRARLRIPDAPVGRSGREHSQTRGCPATESGSRIHGRRRHRQPPRSGRCDGPGPDERDHGVRHRSRDSHLVRRADASARSPDRGLKKLAEETGGGFLLLKKEDELGPTFTRVAQELHSQYVLGFSPAALDGKVHKLEVKLKKPGLNARARKSYLAAARQFHQISALNFPSHSRV